MNLFYESIKKKQEIDIAEEEQLKEFDRLQEAEEMKSPYCEELSSDEAEMRKFLEEEGHRLLSHTPEKSSVPILSEDDELMSPIMSPISPKVRGSNLSEDDEPLPPEQDELVPPEEDDDEIFRKMLEEESLAREAEEAERRRRNEERLAKEVKEAEEAERKKLVTNSKIKEDIKRSVPSQGQQDDQNSQIDFRNLLKKRAPPKEDKKDEVSQIDFRHLLKKKV